MSSFAIISAAGSQHLVAPGEKLTIDRQDAEVGQEIIFDRVLLVSEGGAVSVGTPAVAGATVVAKVISHSRTEKRAIAHFVQRSQQRSIGSVRADVTTVQIVSVKSGAKKAEKVETTEKVDAEPKAAKKAPAKKAE